MPDDIRDLERAPGWFRGADWLAEQLGWKFNNEWKPIELNPFARELADILGVVFRGIYHISEAVMYDPRAWLNPQYIELPIDREMATYDGHELAHMYALTAAAGIRMAIRVSDYRRHDDDGKEYTRSGIHIIFHAKGSSGLCGVMPTLRTQVERFAGKLCSVCEGYSRTCEPCMGTGFEPWKEKGDAEGQA